MVRVVVWVVVWVVARGRARARPGAHDSNHEANHESNHDPDHDSFAADNPAIRWVLSQGMSEDDSELRVKKTASIVCELRAMA